MFNQKIYNKKWINKHPEKIKEYNQKYKEYHKQWEKENKEKRLIQHRIYDKKRREHKKLYHQKWLEEHPEKVKEYNQKNKEYQKQWEQISPKAKERRKKYWKSDKGEKTMEKFKQTIKNKIRELKGNEIRKFKGTLPFQSPNFKSQVTIELVEMVNARDTHCVYCKKELPKEGFRNGNQIHYDHINPFKPFSKTNMIRCCGSCNTSKTNSDVREWCEAMGYTPAPIVIELLNNQKSG